MKQRTLLLPLAALALLTTAGAAQERRGSARTLPAFRSDSELSEYLWARLDARLAAGGSCPGSSSTASVGTVHAATPPTAGASGRPVVVYGSVKNASGAPIPDAIVALTRRSSVRTQASADGTYRLAFPGDTAAKHLTLAARRLGYEPRAANVALRGGDSVRVDFTLCAQAVQLSEAAVTAAPARARSEAITNVQHAGVDEGGIVKLHGDYLVILRRGRLFTVAVRGGDLHRVATVDAFGPGIEPRHGWYDELLVHDDKVVVVGYSYARGGTEIGVFRIDRRGALRHVATYHLRSYDYYSSRNYASRLIGSKLVFYMPLSLRHAGEDPLEVLPAMRRWRGGPDVGEFRRIVTAQRVFRPARPMDPDEDAALHAVTSCDLAAPDLECESTVLVGPRGRVFYVSPSAVYVWASAWRHRRRDRQPSVATLYRMPLDGSPPSALAVSGSPVDQFSFLESKDGHLNVVVRAGADGEGMWRAERTSGGTALFRAPVEGFGDGSRAAPWHWYRPLPSPEGPAFHNRFVGEHLLYGSGNGWGRAREQSSELFVAHLAGGDVARVALPHGTDRIEPMGDDAVVVGTDGRNLHFSGIRLDREPRVVQYYELKQASQGELRSHGFFYKSDGRGSGVLGLPVRSPARPGYAHLFDNSASILYLRNAGSHFERLGELYAAAERARDDACVASCVDWYGNARPIFIGSRVFALLGYELVEGRVRDGRVYEVNRIDFAPRIASAAGW